MIKNELSLEVFNSTYSKQGESAEDMFSRVATKLSEVEKKQDYWAEQFKDLLGDFKFVPGGRILSNAGLELKGTTFINCFVDGFSGEDQDSMEGIMAALKRQAFILKSEGGYGFCADVMRPKGGFIHGIANESPGAVRMLDMWDTQSAVITAGSGKKSKNKHAKGKIRKGAQMVTMSIWHPDIIEFIKAKQDPGRLTKFNMSVLITDAFMHAVKNHLKWNLVFPDFDHDKEMYKRDWDGNLDNWNGPLKVYHTFEDANELWNIIMESTYTRNEPGVLFVDTMNKMNNLNYCEHITATNPCGEQILPVGGVCLLGSFNLTQFVNKSGDGWDFEKLKKYIPIAVRMLDNVNDTTYVPLESQKSNLLKKRRIGMGVMGLGSALMMMKVPYGSDASITLIEELMILLANTAYQSSSALAAEKGSFPLFSSQFYLKAPFIQGLSDETKSMIKKHGLRNSHLLSIQPTGNTSTLANVVSSGLEPIFLSEYIRTAIVPHSPVDMIMPEGVDFKDGTATELYNWEWIKEGDENLLTQVFEGDKYKIDSNRGLTKEHLVEDYAVTYLKQSGEWDPEADWHTTTMNLGIDHHIDVMKVMSKYIDSAMSKTVNLPADYPFDEFKDLYVKLHATGTIKGGTTYRDGTMTSVLSSTNKDNSAGIKKTKAPKRPESLPCDIYHTTVKGVRWIVIVGLLDGDPYEVFAFKQVNLILPKDIRSGSLKKVKRNHYDMIDSESGLTMSNIGTHFDRDEEEALTRMISTALRHGAQINFVVEQLNKSEGTVVSFAKAISRTLKKYIPENQEMRETCESCGGNNIAMEDGCFKCLDCGGSKCS